MEKIDKLKTIPIIGQDYLVPCIIKRTIEPKTILDKGYSFKSNGDAYLNYRVIYSPFMTIWPILNHLHHDKENGQDYYHYHVGYRFIDVHPKFDDSFVPIPKKLHSRHEFAPWLRYDLKREQKDYKIEYHPLKCIRTNQLGVAGNVNTNKLNHKCLSKNNKCPHKGYDLTSEVNRDINYLQEPLITCPLHGLNFDRITKKLI